MSGPRGASGRPRRGAGGDSGRGSRRTPGPAPRPASPRRRDTAAGRSRHRTARRPGTPDGLGGDQVEGRQAVRELLRADRRPVRSLFMAEGMEAAPILDEIEALAARRRVRVEYVPKRRLDALAATDGPQGIVALSRPIPDTELDTLCASGAGGRHPFLLVLDGVTDPRNVGALLRSAEGAGVTGVVFPRHRSAHLSPTTAKAAAGAIEHLPMALVAGIPACLSHLARRGVWTIGMVPDAKQSLYDLTVADDQPIAVVLGSEGAGLAPLSRRRCDVLVGLPQHGALSSLSVSAAGAVACYEIARQREPKRKRR